MQEIVILEDDHTLLDLYADVLRRQAYTVHTFTTVQDMEAFFHSHTVDLCVCDLRIGTMKGEKTVRALRRLQDKYHVPMILVSAQMMVYEPICREHGFEHLLTKPFPNSVLVQLVEQVLVGAESA
ncbi:MAG: response regulator [Chloroflexota bacterium]